jgi:1-piperideine-2-carboxylate/1-pyrroline-2-carboxylate reductase [NAD(P)H]
MPRLSRAAYHSAMTSPKLGWLDAAQTAAALPWGALVDAVEATLRDHAAARAHVPERMVLPMAPGASLFVMPAWLDAGAGDVAITKLISFVGDNPSRGLPAIQGDMWVLRASTGERLALCDGPTVTARRTAAVSALAARWLAPVPSGPLLVIGAGTQGRAHVEAFTELFGVRELWVHSRSAASADALVAHVRAIGIEARRVLDMADALARCPLVVTATTAREVCLASLTRHDAFIAAVGSFKPDMIELAPNLVRELSRSATIVIDSDAARDEAGDLIQAGVDLNSLETLARIVTGSTERQRVAPVLFKSCGSALWDLAAARLLAHA